MKFFLAAKAFIVQNGKVLILKEAAYEEGSQTGQWDLPGGRLNPEEPFLDALKREVKEETGLLLQTATPFFVNDAWPTVKGESWHIVRIFVHCTVENTAVKLGSDHSEFQWIVPQVFQKIPVIQNLFPAFEAYLKEKA